MFQHPPLWWTYLGLPPKHPAKRDQNGFKQPKKDLHRVYSWKVCWDCSGKCDSSYTIAVLPVALGFLFRPFWLLIKYPRKLPFNKGKLKTTTKLDTEDAAKNATLSFRKVTKPRSKQVFLPLTCLEAAHHNSKTPLRDRVPVASSLPLRDRNPRAHALSERPFVLGRLLPRKRGKRKSTHNNKWARQNQKCQSFGSSIERPFLQWNWTKIQHKMPNKIVLTWKIVSYALS